ncbi:MAG: isoprenylcysteine carboxylmethyltransferase family protein [Candidatus Thorarchaeota archaeon]
MDMDLFFRVSFLALWALLGVVRGYYGRKTKTHDSLVAIGEKLKTAEKEVGRWFLAMTAVLSIIGIIGLGLYLLAPPWWTWTKLPFGEAIQWLGVVLAIIPIFFLVWVHRHLDSQWSIALELQEDHELITSGPYKRIRHPMYLGIFVYTIGMILISSDLLVLVFFAFSIWVNYRRIPREEQMMIDEFGGEYQEYMAKTGKLLPRFRQNEGSQETGSEPPK